ncbi:translation initiation factor IF-3, mitochondrial [Seriola lalandi dorsalis]|uniref:Mitochondrial translational initiation factor 3 n=1 Tax=Seriola lalandi dorsalis TaxID=1841481 RepID=A0A3B4Z2M7_SERLL|nr:translation initiation factor IF-3, mitochondrial [Seriola lalandi dorsalis]
MSAGCMRWVLNHAVRAVCGVSLGYRIPASRFLNCSERSSIIAASWSRSPFSTAEEDTERTPAPKKRKQDSRADATISNVGHSIPHQHIQLISETGEELGTIHRVRVIRMMDEQGLKLVLLNAHKDPPVYQLMTGKQIYQEQLKLREKQKAKPATVQVKELTFSPGISPHDLTTKLKQVESWLEKKHHVRITLRSGRNDPAVNLDTTLEQMVQQMEVMVGFVSPPKVIRDGRSAMCIVRQPSAKEISQKGKKNTAATRPAASRSKSAGSSTPPVGTTDTAEGSKQQRSDGN